MVVCKCRKVLLDPISLLWSCYYGVVMLICVQKTFFRPFGRSKSCPELRSYRLWALTLCKIESKTIWQISVSIFGQLVVFRVWLNFPFCLDLFAFQWRGKVILVGHRFLAYILWLNIHYERRLLKIWSMNTFLLMSFQTSVNRELHLFSKENYCCVFVFFFLCVWWSFLELMDLWFAGN